MIKIIDFVLLAIILICGWCGYKKGLIMGIGGIVAIILSLLAANLLALSFSYELVPVMRPFASGYLETTINNEEKGVLVTLGYDDDDYSLADLVEQDPQRAEKISMEAFRRFGIAEDAAEQMTEETLAYERENGKGLLYSLSEVLCQRASRVLCLSLAFLLILIILTVLGNLPNIGFKLPNLDLLNDIGGAVFGVITGILFCILICWCLRYLGLIFGIGNLEKTWFASRLMEGNPVFRFLGI